MRQVTNDLCISYKITDHEEIRLIDKLVVELEMHQHSLESLKNTEVYLQLSAVIFLSDKILLQLIKIHLDCHPF